MIKKNTNKYNYKLIPFQHVITVCLWSAALEAVEKNHSVNKLNKTALLAFFPFTKLLITKILYRHFNSTCVKLILDPLSTDFSLFMGSRSQKSSAHTNTKLTKAWKNVQFMSDLQISPENMSGMLLFRLL